MSLPRTDRDRSEARLFLGATALVFVYLVLRALLVPLVHDEANTFFHFVHNGTWVPFRAHWDAGNHVLAMAVGRCTTALFGAGPLALRSFALLCFLLYAWYVWRVGGVINERMVRWCTWAALLAMPFALEFFALFRGYGPSLAFLLMAIHHLAAAWRSNSPKDAFWASVAMGLGVLANLSLLPMWAAGTMLVTVLALSATKQRAAFIFSAALGALPGLLMVPFALGLRDRGLLYHGNMQGVLNGSVASLVDVMFRTWYVLPRVLAAVLFMLTLYYALRAVKGKARGEAQTLLVVASGLLLAEVGARMVLGGVFEVLYPTYRAAMHWVPLFILGLGLAIDASTEKAPYRRWVALLLLLFPVRAAYVANTRQVSNWSDEYLPATVHDAVVEAQLRAGHNLSISMPPIVIPIWDHYNLTRGTSAIFPDPHEEPDTLADLIIAPASFPVPGSHRMLLAAGPNQLLERSEPRAWVPFAERAWTVPLEAREYLTLLEVPLRAHQGMPVMLSLAGAISGPPEDRGELFLVTELRNGAGEQFHYRALPMHRSLQHGRAELFSMVQVLPPLPPAAEGLVLYIWAPDGRRYALDGVVATLLEPVGSSTTNE